MRRTRLLGAQAELFPDWRHHAFATNRTVPMLVADIDHRDHATIELVIRDLKDQALAHFPSGHMHANSAWTVIAAIAHNLGRWITQIGLPDRPVQTARARRRQLLQIPARLTRTSRQWTLRMPARWPWQHQFTTVLNRDPRAPRARLNTPRRSPPTPADPPPASTLTPARKSLPQRSQGNADTHPDTKTVPVTLNTPTITAITPNPPHPPNPSVDPGLVDQGRVVRPRRRSDPNCALADLDRRVLAVLCAHRVVRQDQLGRLFGEIPERTLRYRTRRLHELGLAGRSRPYRDRGSAPNHHWPTRRADALMHGGPLPRGGERHTPNPVFLGHAAALTELYVAFATLAQAAGLALREYRREGDAREPFKDSGQERALAPDALLVLGDEQGRELRAFVEIDLGTMSHGRLHFKAGLYATYAASDAWHGHHPFLPALLFLTTTPARAGSFLKALEHLLSYEPKRRFGSTSRRPFVAGAGALAFTPGRLLDEGCLADLDGHEGLRLIDVLNAARAPYDEQLAYRRERREAEEEKRRRLWEKPEAMREHLRRHENRLGDYGAALGPGGAQALALLLASDERPLPDERGLLRAIARDFGEALVEPTPRTIPSPGAEAKGQATLLIGSYRSIQERQLRALADQHGVGPHLRKAAAQLRSGLIEPRDLQALPREAEHNAAGREEQRKRRLAYLEWRKGAARQRARKAGLLGRPTHRAEDFYEPVNRRWLRVCRRCEEIVYPAVGASSGLQEEPACHYCHSTERVTAYRKDDRTDQEGEMYL